MKTNKNNKKTTVGAKKEAKESRKHNIDKRIDQFDESRTTNDPLALRKGEDGSQVSKRLKSNHDGQSDCNLPPLTSTWSHTIETQSPSNASGMEFIDLTGDAETTSSNPSKQDDQSDHNLPVPTSTWSHTIETQSPSIASGMEFIDLTGDAETTSSNPSKRDDQSDHNLPVPTSTWSHTIETQSPSLAFGGFSDVATTTNVETNDLMVKTETIEDKVDPKCDDVELDSFRNPRHFLDEDYDEQYTDLYEKLCNCDQNKTHK